jgi:putative transposase
MADGAKVADVCRKYGVSRTTIHRWQKKHAQGLPEGAARAHRVGTATEPGSHVEGGKSLHRLEFENAQLKRIVVQQALEIDSLRDLAEKRRDC